MAKQFEIKGNIISVDDEDWELVCRNTWHLAGGRPLYVATSVKINGKATTKYLHRLIMGEPKGFEIDHINGNPFDNRRSNLRVVTRTQNEQNKGLRADSKTGFRGVCKKEGRFVAYVYVNKKQIWLGRFPTAEEASEVAQAARARYMTHAPECRKNA